MLSEVVAAHVDVVDRASVSVDEEERLVGPGTGDVVVGEVEDEAVEADPRAQIPYVASKWSDSDRRYCPRGNNSVAPRAPWAVPAAIEALLAAWAAAFTAAVSSATPSPTAP